VHAHPTTLEPERPAGWRRAVRPQGEREPEFFGQPTDDTDRRIAQNHITTAIESRRRWSTDARALHTERTTMDDSQMTRPRSGDQWIPRRTAGPSITVTVAEPTANTRRVPFGFGIREQEPVTAEAEWEGNPS
jgi:hypothetical protein